MYRYDEFDRQFVAERVAQFRDQATRRLAGELTEDEFKASGWPSSRSPASAYSASTARRCPESSCGSPRRTSRSRT